MSGAPGDFGLAQDALGAGAAQTQDVVTATSPYTGDLIFSDPNTFPEDLVAVDRDFVSPVTTVTLVADRERYHVSRVPSGDLVLVPSVFSLNGTNHRILTVPEIGGTPTVYFDPSTDSVINGKQIQGARIDSQGRMVLAWDGPGQTIRIRRYAVGFGSTEDWTVSRIDGDAEVVQRFGIGPDGDKVAAVWRHASTNNVSMREYTLQDGGTSYVETVHVSGGDGIAFGSESTPNAYAVGYHADGGVLYGYGIENVVGPDGFGRYDHPITVYLTKIGGAGGGYTRDVFAYDANPALEFEAEYIGASHAFFGLLMGDTISGDTVWGWFSFNSSISPTGRGAMYIIESRAGGPAFHLWKDDVTPDQVPLAIGGGGLGSLAGC